MKFTFSVSKLITGLIGVVALGALSFSIYQYSENKNLTPRVSSLESQVASLYAALQESAVLSEANKLQLQELTNRSSVIARSQDELLTTAVSKASPAVVSIVISKDVPQLEVRYVNPFGDDPYFRDVGFRTPVFKQVGTKKQQVGAGTGFIIHPNGYILTNKHVVDDEDAEYTALLASSDKKPAKVIYRDQTNDVAIIKIEGGEYPVIPLGNSADLKLGQTVAAIGNALGEYNNSVSVGIISGLDRTIQAQDNYGRVETLSGVIQTDAAINRGNSGGPLLDLSGKVVGMNVAMERGASNIAFAIPVDTIKLIIGRVLP